MELTQFLHRNRQTAHDRTALVCGGDRRSHGALHDRVARLAAALQAHGVVAGDRVALLALNAIEVVEVVLACWWVGAVACPLNTRWSDAETALALDDCGAGLLFVDDAHAALTDSVCGRRRVVPLASCAALAATHEPAADGRYGNDALAVLLYTGGTTGRAKAVMLTHANLSACVLCWRVDTGPFGDGICLLATPLFHIAGLMRVLVHLHAAGTCVMAPQFRARTALELIEREGVTHLSLVPSMLQMLLDDETFAPQRLQHLRRLGYGAAPSAGALLRRAIALLPWVGFYQAYGMSESAGLGTSSRPEDHTPDGWTDGRAQSAGSASATIELRVVGADGRDAAPGEVGEIVLRGPSVMPGYWQRPDETAQALRDGWLHTGDGGRLDADGRLTVVDRLKDMIVSGGENVYSAEVENALAQHPAVSMCGVIGVPSARWGEAVHAVVVLRDGAAATETALRRHCRALLADYKCPKTISFVDALPLTAAGKVAKNVLRQRHADPTMKETTP